MAKNRVVILTARGVVRGIPEPVTAGLAVLTGEADGVLAAAMGESTRAPVVTARCREVFGKPEARMRTSRSGISLRRHWMRRRLSLWV